MQHISQEHIIKRNKTVDRVNINGKNKDQPLTFSFLQTSIEYLQNMGQFDIEKAWLTGLIRQAETRKFAEEIEQLSKRGNDLHWLIRGLQSHQKKGILEHEISIQKRVQTFGTNHKYEKPMSTFCELFKEALDDFILKILIVASLLSIVIEVSVADESHRTTAWIEGFVILVAVAIVGLVTAANNYTKERQFRKIKGVAEERKRVTVWREGQLRDLHMDDVLVGDIVQISEGMEVPADAVLLEANEVTTDESAMTGESEPVSKNILSVCNQKRLQLEQNGQKEDCDKHEVPSPILMSGTKVLTGEGKMMVLVVGPASCIGQIRQKMGQEEEGQTPLQEKLETLAQDIGKFGLISAAIILVALLVRFAIEKAITKNWDNSVDIKELISYFILALTVVVVAIPEGLPLSVTLSLAVSVQKMLLDSNLVRRMDACETMGGANNICSDKTGTLTMNKMTLTHLWHGKTIDLDCYGESASLSAITNNSEWNQLLKISVCVNSSALLEPEEKGSSTELALLKFMRKAGIDYTPERTKYPTLTRFPFSSSRKRMSVVVEAHPGQPTLFVKGASEMVLGSCNRWFDPSANRIDVLSASIKQKVEDAIRKMAESSLRTLCLAYKPINPQDNLEAKDQKGVFDVQKQGLTLLCIVGVRDIPRKEVPEAIAKCHRAGITVRMVTGDNIVTAAAIARDVGIIQLNDDSLVMEGPKFMELVGGVVCKQCRTRECECAVDLQQAKKRNVPLRVDTIQNAEQFDKIKDKLLVLARSRPEDKYALVTGLRERGEVVAATGDGTNDAPALKKADVGFAMGIAGTEVARQAAAIILLDDNFNSIVKAVLWGRNIYDSIRKFIQFQITINIVAVLITLIGAGLIRQQVFAPIQMLWINLIMDTLASLALATEPPQDELLNRKPNDRREHIVSRTMLKHILGQAALQVLVLIALIFWGELFIPEYVDSYDTTQYLTHPEWKWHNGVIGGTVCSGRDNTISGDSDYQTAFNTNGIYSRHFTFIFNAFVMLQIFNFINCRKIHDELNILSGITQNPTFIVIVLGIIALQILLVTFGGAAFQVYSNYGLAPKQWLICVAIGTLSTPVNFLLKFIPISEAAPKSQQASDKRCSQQFSEGVQPTKQQLGTDSHIIKVREFAKSPSKFATERSKMPRAEIIEIGFH